MGIDVHEYRDRADIGYRLGCCDVGEGRGNHLIAPLDPRGKQRKMQGIRAGSNSHGMFHSVIARDLLFKRLALRTKDKMGALYYTEHSVVDLVLDRVVLDLEVDHRYRHTRENSSLRHRNESGYPLFYGVRDGPGKGKRPPAFNARRGGPGTTPNTLYESPDLISQRIAPLARNVLDLQLRNDARIDTRDGRFLCLVIGRIDRVLV